MSRGELTLPGIWADSCWACETMNSDIARRQSERFGAALRCRNRSVNTVPADEARARRPDTPDATDTANSPNGKPADCPVCGAPSATAFTLGSYAIADCPSCHHRFLASALSETHLASIYDDSYFFGGGDGYDDYLTEADLLRAQGERYGRLLAEYAEPGRALDIGSAAGFLQCGLEAAGWTTQGLEPNLSMVEHARSKLGLQAQQGSLESPPDWKPFDAICLIQVIGHFYDLPRALASAARLTRPGGLCLIEYWRRESWIARLLGKRWHEYSPPSVLHWFSRSSLDGIMARNGFTAIAAGTPRKYISGGHAKSLLAHKLAQLPMGRALTAGTALIPASTNFRYPAFDLEWRLYRRNDETVTP